MTPSEPALGIASVKKDGGMERRGTGSDGARKRIRRVVQYEEADLANQG